MIRLHHPRGYTFFDLPGWNFSIGCIERIARHRLKWPSSEDKLALLPARTRRELVESSLLLVTLNLNGEVSRAGAATAPLKTERSPVSIGNKSKGGMNTGKASGSEPEGG